MPITSYPTEIFRDKKFKKWANAYLNSMAHDVVDRKNLHLVHLLKSEASALRVHISDQDWRDFYKYNFCSANNMSATDHRLLSFIRPLFSLFKKWPNLLDDKMVIGKKQRKKQGRYLKSLFKDRKQWLKNKGFVDWANNYLYRVFKEVVFRSSRPEICNAFLWNELKLAAKKVGNHGQHFNNFDAFRQIALEEIHIHNVALIDFVRPLWHIYMHLKETISKASRRSNVSLGARSKVSTYVNTVNNFVKKKSILETAPIETINVIAYHTKLPSKLSSASFERRVLDILTYCLKKGYRWISCNHLAELLGVEERGFENWILKNSRIVSRATDSKGLQCSLKPVEFPLKKGVVMTTTPATATNTQPESQNGQVTATVVEDNENSNEKALEIGTPDFDTAFTQLMSDGPVWRTSATIADKLAVDQPKLTEWADANKSILRRPGKEEGVLYYAAMSRWGEDNSAADNNTNGNNTNGKKGPQNKANNSSSKATPKNPKISTAKTKELLAFAMLHRGCDDLVRLMNFYANGLATRHPEAFSHLTQSQKSLASAVSLLQRELKVKDNQLPDLEGI